LRNEVFGSEVPTASANEEVIRRLDQYASEIVLQVNNTNPQDY